MPSRLTAALAPLIACAAWLVAGGTLAAPAPAAVTAATRVPAPVAPSVASIPTAVGEVLVQGHTPTPPSKTYDKTVHKYVEDTGHTGPLGQISRWWRPLCPMIAGISPGFGQFLVKRIREVAAEVGAPQNGECGKGVNVLVVVTATPVELMADVRDHHEDLLGFHGTHETRDLAVFEPAMKSWYVTGTSGPGYWVIDSPYAPQPWWGPSLKPPPLKSHIVFVLIVVDARLLEGQAIGPVADKIAMLALSHPALHEGCSPLPSVLEVLDPKCPPGAAPAALTSYDKEYLKALYAYKGNEFRYF